jgi:hypothetical protein
MDEQNQIQVTGCRQVPGNWAKAEIHRGELRGPGARPVCSWKSLRPGVVTLRRRFSPTDRVAFDLDCFAPVSQRQALALPSGFAKSEIRFRL